MVLSWVPHSALRRVALFCLVALGCQDGGPSGPDASDPLSAALPLSLSAVLRLRDGTYLAALSSGADTAFLPLDPCQAWVVSTTLEHEPTGQPTARDLFLTMADSLGASLDHLLLHLDANGDAVASLYVRTLAGAAILEATCSDAMAIAQRSSAPLLGTRALLRRFRQSGASGTGDAELPPTPRTSPLAEGEPRAARPARARQERVPVRILGLVDQQIDVLVALVDQSQQTVVPVFVNYCQAEAIYAGLHDPGHAAARRHALLRDLLSAAQATVAAALVTDLVGAAYLGQVEVASPRGLVRLQARPSDALALAALTGAPLYVTTGVLQAAGEEATPYLSFFSEEENSP
ncbi:MAG: bifunctional nuclease domain-containing protein [Candidatus Latescibacterota bacterium]